MPRHTARQVSYNWEDVDARLTLLSAPGQVQRAVFWLNPEDRAWNPASTKGELSGPGRVEYTRHPDGGIDVHVGPL